jgi:ribonuclease R
LIRGLSLGEGGLDTDEAARLADLGTHITITERRAAMAERDAVDRYLAAYLSGRIGDVFEARISGVTRFALFVSLRESGASGIVPVSTLPDDFWMHDEATQTLTGRRSRLSFRLGQEVDARLIEASPVTGGLVFHLMPGTPNSAAAGSRRSSTEGRRSRQR